MQTPISEDDGGWRSMLHANITALSWRMRAPIATLPLSFTQVILGEGYWSLNALLRAVARVGQIFGNGIQALIAKRHPAF